MTEQQWQILMDVIQGRPVAPLPTGFIIDCPWLPGWAGISTLDYFTCDSLWLEVNLKAVQTFPEVIFIPGFWPEFGMCTEPSAFGTKCIWHHHEMPFAEKMIHNLQDIDRLSSPDPRTDGLCPFVLNRMKHCRSAVEKAGHAFRFAVARGPLNVASFLMGATEFLMALRDDPERIHRLLHIITEFIVQWLTLQRETVDTIDGILVLDDIVGFCGPPDFETFVRPYLSRIFTSQEVTVKMFHNDADGRVCAPHLADLGINLFNFSFLHSLEQMRQWVGPQVALLGNIPPRDVMALGRPEQVRQSVYEALKPWSESTGLILSCGGGMSGGVSSENIQAFVEAAEKGIEG